MLPDARNHNTDAAYVRALMDRIGRSQSWIAKRIGISRRRLQYLVAGTRAVNGVETEVQVTYPEQFALECLADDVRWARWLSDCAKAKAPAHCCARAVSSGRKNPSL